MFSCFCTSLDLIQYYIEKESKIDTYRLKSALNIKQRGALVDNFRQSENNSIMITSYELGSDGLNLQCANVVIIVDYWWNSSKTQQSISRVLRNGQSNKEVDIYFFTSNTGIEKCLFEKQEDKNLLLEQIKNGDITHTVKKLSMDSILKLIDSNENKDYIHNMY